MFVISYLCIHYFWNYDKALEVAKQQQSEEVNRIKTVLNLTERDLTNSLEDYASWNDLSDYIDKPNQEFIDDSINDHAFSSLKLNGIFIFDSNVNLIWGRHYDPFLDQELSYDEIRYKFGSLLANTLQSPKDKITTNTKFLVINDNPVLMATSRVCNSHGKICDKGYMMMLKPINKKFTHTLKLATGIDVTILIKEKSKIQELPSKNNISIIKKLDSDNKSITYFMINHTIKIPRFISFGELSAILSFASFMFIANLYLAHLILKPFKKARLTLEYLSKGDIPPTALADRFISQEIRDFAHHINQVFIELDTQKKELEWMSYHDTLTKVANRRKLQIHWDEVSNDHHKNYISVALIDIDYFKPFNDNYGHLEGDIALQMVAQALKESATECDKFVARFGGEEFYIVLSSSQPIDSEKEASLLIESINRLAIPHKYTETEVNWLTISLGMVSCQQQPLHCQKEILLIADQALYQAKANGRNRYVIEKYQSCTAKSNYNTNPNSG
ncbi:sensor domain-containing diguanylate cyclase [Aliivibrio wodanis]|uniref:sensor domain-containing diguanylate cyclase n=1 Tax=Aliivibrio wodanis TaxID=80852 RepID=UPI00406CF967